MNPPDQHDSPLGRSMAKEIAQQIESLSDVVVRGQVESWDDYRSKVGHLEGLRQAYDLIEETERKLVRRENGRNENAP